MYTVLHGDDVGDGGDGDDADGTDNNGSSSLAFLSLLWFSSLYLELQIFQKNEKLK